MKAKCEIWLVIDEDGAYEVGAYRDAATENFEQNISSSNHCRIVRIDAFVSPPRVETAEVQVSDEAGETIEAAEAETEAD